MDVERLAEF